MSCRAQPLSFSLSAAQSSVSDWKEGTRSSLEIKSTLQLRFTALWRDMIYAATLRASLGGTRQRLGEAVPAVLHPTENELFCEAAVSHPLKWKIDPFVSTSLRTQITESFRVVAGSRLRSAAFRDPITTMQSAGCSWEHRGRGGAGTLRAGVALKQIRSKFHTTLSDNPRSRSIQERWKSEVGVELVYEAAFKLDSLLAWRGRISTFTAAHQLEDSSVLFENEFRYRMWSAFGCVMTIRIHYDPIRTRTVQFQQALSIGLIL